jgi:hypothetical protein
MIVLKEIIHTLEKEKEDGMVHTDDWRWPDLDHLVTMGFDFDGDFKVSTKIPPHIVIYKKKDKGDDGKTTENFYVEEKGKATRRFKEFNEIIDYFDTYSQPELDKLK